VSTKNMRLLLWIPYYYYRASGFKRAHRVTYRYERFVQAANRDSRDSRCVTDVRNPWYKMV